MNRKILSLMLRQTIFLFVDPNLIEKALRP